MKTKEIIQRLCLFLLLVASTTGAWATDYNRSSYSIFRSRETVEKVGKKKQVRTLHQWEVEITFSDCKTTSGTDNSAIYELAKGSKITVKADEGYSIRWIILRDTEGGKRYSDKEGIKRIDRVTSGYDYYFERDALSNSKIKERNWNGLNDDDNNIVVYNYDAPARSVEIVTHNNSKWGQFKVRDIIVGVVKLSSVSFEQERYHVYYRNKQFRPELNKWDHEKYPEYEVNNNQITDVERNGTLHFKRPGTVVLTAIFNSTDYYAKKECSTVVEIKRDRVTFGDGYLAHLLLDKTSDLRKNLIMRTESGEKFDWENSGFSVTSSNPNVLRYADGKLYPGSTSGEATITVKQEENDYYEASSLSYTVIVMRADYNGAALIKDANEWKLFCKSVNEKGINYIYAKLEANIDLGKNSMMVGTEDHKYRGTFDGQGHTLTVHVVGTGQGTAPFNYTNGATIHNLTIAGSVTAPAGADNFHTAGLVGFCENTTLRRCVVKAAIHLERTGDQYSAGLVGHILPGNNIIEDCAFVGSITGDKGNVSNISGLVAWGDNGTTTIRNSYVNATYTKVSGLNPILRRDKGSANNLSHVYYSEKSKGIHPDNEKNGNLGEQVTEAQLKSGEVTKKLQADRTYDSHWAQVLGENPSLYSAADKAKANYVYYDSGNRRWACDNFRLTDGQPLPIGLDFTAANVTYNRTGNSAQNATICLPYELPRNNSFQAHFLSGGGNDKVYFKEATGTLEAYRPYYITANGTPQLGGTNLQVKAYTDARLTATAKGYTFTGTVTGMSNATAAAAKAYILQDDGKFHKVTTEYPEAVVPIYRAYITCPPQASGAKELFVVLDGVEPTGIDGVTNDAADVNSPVYNLRGQRVADRFDAATRSQLPAGIYIVGGRKVIVK
ncbi:hypothetical protein [Hoylesella oralis]|uniref:hypothetical protein n=1 Tax=Hoylesella oralis TaxID=28134 RepID=UPI0003D2D199|nr:hypothetical protein HMPREF1199_01402 [Hoylesella oralis CC98A]